MKQFLILIVILNIFDAFATLFGLSIGAINELNPIMNKLYNIQPLLFIAVKVLLAGILMFIIYIDRIPKTKTLLVLSGFTVCLYSVVCSMHFIWIIKHYIV